MFGYLTAYLPELSEENRRIYQGYYCGLCKALGDRFGKKGRLILAYDLVFLAILNNALYEHEEKTESFVCVYKASRSERCLTEELSYAADMNMLLAYNNFRDQAHDSASRRARAALKLLKKDYTITADRYPRQKEAVEKYLKELSEIEEKEPLNPDEAANATGRMLSEVFLYKEDEYSKYLRPMLYYLGKYIYLIDAYVDIQDDIASGSFNPYRLLYGKPDFDDVVLLHLESVMGECTKYYEMLPVIRHTAILCNILYAGLLTAYSKTRKQRTQKKGSD